MSNAAVRPSTSEGIGSNANGSRPSTSTVPAAAASACMAVIPGTVSTATSGTSARTARARYPNVEYTFGSPIVANAAVPPVSRSQSATR